MSQLPSWYPGNERKPAPMPLLRVQALVNSLDVEEGSDLLGDRSTAREWLIAAGLLDPNAELSDPDVALAREVREAIRALLGGTPTDDELEPLRRLAAEHSARLSVGDGGALGLEGARSGRLSDGLFGLLLIVRAAQEDGSWPRLKTCANDECRWAFFDRSRNQHGSWCHMDSCGNRLKNRELRARRR